MSDVTTFLRARLDDIERVAGKATQGVWKLWGMDVYADVIGDSNLETATLVADVQSSVPGQLRTWNALHIIAHDPQRALRDVAAKRKLIELAVADHYRVKVKSDPHAFDCNHWSEKQEKWVSHDDAYADCETLLVLAAVYSEHPNYRKEWQI